MNTILAALKHIRDFGPNMKAFGICTNILNQLAGRELVTSWLETKAIEWCSSGRGTPESNMTYPVGGEAEYDRDGRNRTMWINPKRIAYLNWLIEKAEQEGV